VKTRVAAPGAVTVAARFPRTAAPQVRASIGLAAMWIAVAGVYLFHIWLLNRTGGGYAGNAEEMLRADGR
jgi:hypothetical protein